MAACVCFRTCRAFQNARSAVDLLRSCRGHALAARPTIYADCRASNFLLTSTIPLNARSRRLLCPSLMHSISRQLLAHGMLLARGMNTLQAFQVALRCFLMPLNSDLICWLIARLKISLLMFQILQIEQ